MDTVPERRSFEPLSFIAWIAVGLIWIVAMWGEGDRYHDLRLERTFRYANPTEEQAARTASFERSAEMLEWMWWGSIACSILGGAWFLRRGCGTAVLAFAFLLFTTFIWTFLNMV